MSSLDNALFAWRAGERRLAEAPPDRRALLERVTETVVDALRRRLGGSFSGAELAQLYESGTDWCLELAMRVAPADPWAWDGRLVADAAFARYLREASDYAGGRFVQSE